jgi:hypothetical protein
MERALIMLVLALRGCGRAIRMADADLEPACSGTGRKLRNDRPGKHRMEHQRIGGDPADELAPKSPRWPLRYHSHALPRTVASSRITQDTVQQKFIA